MGSLAYLVCNLPAVAETVLACPKLRHLELYMNPWGGKGVARLCAELSKGSLPEVRRLGFDETDAGDEGCAAVAKLIADGKLPKLTHLRFYGCGIGDVGFRALTAALEDFPTHVECSVYNNIEGEGKKEFHKMQDKKQVEPGYVPQFAPPDAQKVVLVAKGCKGREGRRAARLRTRKAASKGARDAAHPLIASWKGGGASDGHSARGGQYVVDHRSGRRPFAARESRDV